jgi:Putative peptidoglycan binding domain
MRSDRIRRMQRGVLRSLFFASLFAAPGLSAQTRVTLPAGSVIIVRTTTALESSTAQSGQTFTTVVDETVGVDNYTVIPAGTQIGGVITFAQPSTRQQSGVIEVSFDRLILSDGTTYPITARLTSTDAAERRQIDSDPNARVVLVGGRGGIGAAIAGAGSTNSPTSSILTALGGLLSQGQNVSVPAGTRLAVQLDQQVALRTRGSQRAPDANTIYTATDRIRAAQQALAQQNYYRGAITGQLDDATQRALFEYQTDKRLPATGNLDWRTSQALGLVTTGEILPSPTASGTVLSASDASLVRRNAQALVGRQRQELAVSGVARVNSRRAYAEGDVDLWFALSAFTDNASLYEQLVTGSGNVDASALAGRALVNAARRVDDAMQRARPSGAVQSGWASIRRQLGGIDPGYTGR